MAQQTFRVFWHAHKGRQLVNFNAQGITRHSVVMVSACEFNPLLPLDTGSGNPPPHDPERLRFIGDANIWVSNIMPHGPDDEHGDPGRVSFIINIDWDSPLNVATDIIVFDPPPPGNLIESYRFPR